MEDTLRDPNPVTKGFDVDVLILVLMEDTLRAMKYFSGMDPYSVLILVLMEDTLRERVNTQEIPY